MLAGVHLPSNHPVVPPFYRTDSAIDVHELAFVPIAHHRSRGRGRPTAPDSDHASETCFVLEHQAHVAPAHLFRIQQGRQCFGEFFFHSSCTKKSLLGCRVSGATLRQPWRASMRYTTDAATGCPSSWASAARNGETTNMLPWSACAIQGARNSRSSSILIDARRRPPQLGRASIGFATLRRNKAWSLGTVARPTPSAAAVSSKVASSNAGSRTACAQRRSSRVSASIANA